jgi:hypothetical protein
MSVHRLEKRDMLTRALEERKEYELFLKWVDDGNIDEWLSFPDWLLRKYTHAIADASEFEPFDDEPNGAA